MNFIKDLRTGRYIRNAMGPATNQIPTSTQGNNMIKFNVKHILTWARTHMISLSAETLGWLAVVLIHSATVPTLLAVLTGLSDKMPTVDLVLLTWAGLVALFCQACVQRNMLQIVTIAAGFMLQSSLMALIFFR